VIYAKAEAAKNAKAEAQAAADARKRELEEKRIAKANDARSALINPCQTCGTAIAKTAKTCPHCGAKQRHPVGKMAYLVAAGGLTLFILAMASSAKHEEQSKAAAARLLKERPDILHRSAAKDICQKMLTSSLRDPNSLVIESMEQHYEAPTAVHLPSVITVFGIRAKNGFGGYTSSGHTCQVEIDPKADTAKIIHFGKLY
jgi:hypothetical protein